MVANIDFINTKKVVVLIPPPVEPGDAPINMIIINKIIVGTVNRVMSIMLKPAVLPEIVWNKIVPNFSIKEF